MLAIEVKVDPDTEQNPEAPFADEECLGEDARDLRLAPGAWLFT
jgi:hypothetical protein